MAVLRWIAWGVAVTLLLLIALVGLAPSLLDINRYRDSLATELEKTTGGKVTIANLSWGWGHGLWVQLDRLALSGTPRFAANLSIAKTRASVALLPLLSRQLTIEELELVKPSLQLTVSPAEERGSGNATVKSRTLPVDIQLDQAKIDGGRLDVRFAGSNGAYDSLVLRDLEARISYLGVGQKTRFEVTAKVGDGSGPPAPLRWKGSLSGWTASLSLENPVLELDTSVQDLPLPFLAGYSPNTDLVEQLSGSVSGDISIESDLGKHLSASASVNLGALSIVDKTLWQEPLSLAGAKLTFRLSLDPAHIQLQDAALAWGSQRLRLKGAVTDWKQHPKAKDVVLNSTLQLKALVSTVPWPLLGEYGQRIRALFERGGVVTIHEARLDTLDLSDSDDLAGRLIAAVDAPITLSGVTADPGGNLPEFEDLSANVLLRKGVLSASDVKARLGPIALPVGSFEITNLMSQPTLVGRAKGPVSVTHSADQSVEQLLQAHGLESLSGEATVDIELELDLLAASARKAHGSINLANVDAKATPSGAVLEDVHGILSLSLAEIPSIEVRGLGGRLDGTTFFVDGTAKRIGQEDLEIDATVKSGWLDLSRLAEFAPPLKPINLSGQANLDVEIQYPHAKPESSRLRGKLGTKNVSLELTRPDLRVGDLNGSVQLQGNSVQSEQLDVAVDGQRLVISGHLTNPKAPAGWLTVSAESLDVDELTAVFGRHESAGERAGPATGAAAPSLPPWLAQANLKLKADVDRGKFRSQTFSNLKLEGSLEHGRINDQVAEIDIAGGHVSIRGSTDLRNPAAPPFDLQPNLQKIALEQALHLFGSEQVLAHGPVRLVGDLEGTGPAADLLSKLTGKLVIAAGPGTLARTTILGDALFDILAFVHVKGLLEGDLHDGADRRGIPYDSLAARIAFDEGVMTMHRVTLVTPALSLDGAGTLGLADKQIDVTASIKLLGTVDEVLDVVPVLGKSAQDLTELHLRLTGTLSKPHYRVIPGTDVADAVADVVRSPTRDVKRAFKALEKRL
jgi:uncharacterized protein involved in outer membrane biogenesis